MGCDACHANDHTVEDCAVLHRYHQFITINNIPASVLRHYLEVILVSIFDKMTDLSQSCDKPEPPLKKQKIDVEVFSHLFAGEILLLIAKKMCWKDEVPTYPSMRNLVSL